MTAEDNEAERRRQLEARVQTPFDTVRYPARKPAILTRDWLLHNIASISLRRPAFLTAPYALEVRDFDGIANDAFEDVSDVALARFSSNYFASLPCGTGFVHMGQAGAAWDAVHLIHSRSLDAVSSDPPDLPHKHSKDTGNDDCCDSGGTSRGEAAVTPPLCANEPPVLINLAGEAVRFGFCARFWHPKSRPLPPTATVWPHRLLPVPAVIAEEEKESLAEVPVNRRDVFSTLYASVENLVLENTPWQPMPDLHRFERMRSLTVADGRFSRIEPGCPHWCRARTAYEASAAYKRRANTHAPLSHASVEAPREAELGAMRAFADAATHFCPHERISFQDFEQYLKAGHDAQRLPFPTHLRQPCSTTRFLNLSGNRIRTFDDLIGLLCYKSASVVDLSDNEIDDFEALLIVVSHMPQLVQLKLDGNPCVASLPDYRERVRTACPSLKVLDCRPYYGEECQNAEAPAMAPPAPHQELLSPAKPADPSQLTAGSTIKGADLPGGLTIQTELDTVDTTQTVSCTRQGNHTTSHTSDSEAVDTSRPNGSFADSPAALTPSTHVSASPADSHQARLFQPPPRVVAVEVATMDVDVDDDDDGDEEGNVFIP